ncbi:hypothetical protein [Xanthomonas axonopodis]|uniref:hypothetical protein n=1 Tax=Xanthomonas axonopodis TaxID=53413 RepID=UPI0035566443
MLIDTTEFPLVWMSLKKSSPDSDASQFAEFEALLARKEVFVIINDEGLDGEEHSHTKEEAKQTTLWMKRNKPALKAYIKAGIYIEPNAAKRLATKAFAVVFEKFWGYPMLIVATKDEALTLAQRLLQGKLDAGGKSGVEDSR